MQTYTGQLVDLMNPQVDTINLPDISHHLGNINRWCGALRKNVSVLEHSIICYAWVEKNKGTPEEQLHALLHDAHEAYMGDITTPVSMAIESLVGSGFNPVEIIKKNLDKAIGEKFGIDLLAQRSIVKTADDIAMRSEFMAFSLRPPVNNWFVVNPGDKLLRIKRRLSIIELQKIFSMSIRNLYKTIHKKELV